MFSAYSLGALLAAVSLGFFIYGLCARSRPIVIVSAALVLVSAVVVWLIVYASGIVFTA